MNTNFTITVLFLDYLRFKSTFDKQIGLIDEPTTLSEGMSDLIRIEYSCAISQFTLDIDLKEQLVAYSKVTNGTHEFARYDANNNCFAHDSIKIPLSLVVKAYENNTIEQLINVWSDKVEIMTWEQQYKIKCSLHNKPTLTLV